MSDPELEKVSAAKEAVKHVKSGMLIGLGTGSTVYHFLKELSGLVKAGLDITGVSSSIRTEALAKEFGIKTVESVDRKIDITFDGADETDLSGNLVKGGGGALVREKILAYNSVKMYVLVDSSKIKKEGIGKFGIPIEILQFLPERTKHNVEALGGSCTFRDNKKFISDNGNLIIDCDFGIIDEPQKLELNIKKIPGVVEVGIFTSLAKKIFEGRDGGCKVHELTPES